MEQKYNLLYVFADQWRRSAMGCAEEDPVFTPNIDKFASEGVRCTACTSTFPVCSPHRACLMTGKYPQSNGFFINCNDYTHVHLKEDEICLGDVLKQYGYQTAYIGKWHLDEPECNYCKAPASKAKGWDAFTPPGRRRHGFDYWYSYGTYDEHLSPHYWQDSPEMINIDKWSVEHETDIAISWLNKIDKSKPFAAVISWNPPHTPYDKVPEKYRKIYNNRDFKLRGNVKTDITLHNSTGSSLHEYSTQGALREATCNYFSAVCGIDEQFGRLLEALNKLNLTDNTIVILSSDHGDMMGSHGLMAKNIWYEEAIGIPFVIKGPKIKCGICNSVFSSVDQMPTILSLLDLPIPDTVEGIDVSEDIKKAVTDKEKSAFIYSPAGHCWRENENNDWIFSAGWRGIRTNRYCYVLDAGYNKIPNLRRMLYDLKEDPLQMKPQFLDSALSHPVAAELEKRVKDWLIKEEDPFYDIHLRNN